MTFILAATRDPSEDVVGLFRAYQEYLVANRERFPRSAFALATSEWYSDFRDPRCPHDAWLEQVRIEEPATGERQEVRQIAIRVRLLGAYHDGYIELYCPAVSRYALDVYERAGGHRDWRYDEFRVTDAGRLIHEIEWWGAVAAGRWIIEASDVEFLRVPSSACNGSRAR